MLNNTTLNTWFRFSFTAFLAMFLATTAQAAPGTPDEVIDAASKRIITEIEPQKDALRKDSAKLYKLVEDIIIPHFDFAVISKRVLGKTWKSANESQRVRFSEAFKNLLVRTYSNALLEYSGENIKWMPLKEGSKPGRAIKEAEIALASGQTVPMKWGLHQTGESWKVYDISIDGISLVTNYRSVFAGEVRKNGLDALIERLEKKNASGETAS